MIESYFDDIWQTLFFGGREYLSLMIEAYDFKNLSLESHQDGSIGYEISFRADNYLFQISGTGFPRPRSIHLKVTVPGDNTLFWLELHPEGSNSSVNQLRERIELFTNKSLQF
jgi:hypothetical protein